MQNRPLNKICNMNEESNGSKLLEVKVVLCMDSVHLYCSRAKALNNEGGGGVKISDEAGSFIEFIGH